MEDCREILECYNKEIVLKVIREIKKIIYNEIRIWLVLDLLLEKLVVRR